MKTIAILLSLMFALQSCSLTHHKSQEVLEPPVIDEESDPYKYKTYTEEDAVKYWPQTGPKQGETLKAAVENVVITAVGVAFWYGLCRGVDGLIAVVFGSEWKEYASPPIGSDDDCSELSEIYF